MSFTPVSTVTPANVSIQARSSATFYWRATLQDSSGTPISLTGYHFRMQIFDKAGNVLFDLVDETNPVTPSGTLGVGVILMQGNTDIGGGTLGTGVVLAVLPETVIALAAGLANLSYAFWATNPLTIPTPSPTAIIDKWFTGVFELGA